MFNKSGQRNNSKNIQGAWIDPLTYTNICTNSIT